LISTSSRQKHQLHLHAGRGQIGKYLGHMHEVGAAVADIHADGDASMHAAVALYHRVDQLRQQC
jgi:hypothetical protein